MNSNEEYDPLLAAAERLDHRAEEWLKAQHSKDWYIGDATEAEWEAAYEATAP